MYEVCMYTPRHVAYTHIRHKVACTYILHTYATPASGEVSVYATYTVCTHATPAWPNTGGVTQTQQGARVTDIADIIILTDSCLAGHVGKYTTIQREIERRTDTRQRGTKAHTPVWASRLGHLEKSCWEKFSKVSALA